MIKYYNDNYYIYYIIIEYIISLENRLQLSMIKIQ